MDLTSQPIIFILTGETIVLKAIENLLNGFCRLSKHWLAGTAEFQLTSLPHKRQSSQRQQAGDQFSYVGKLAENGLKDVLKELLLTLTVEIVKVLKLLLAFKKGSFLFKDATKGSGKRNLENLLRSTDF